MNTKKAQEFDDEPAETISKSFRKFSLFIEPRTNI